LKVSILLIRFYYVSLFHPCQHLKNQIKHFYFPLIPKVSNFKLKEADSKPAIFLDFVKVIAQDWVDLIINEQPKFQHFVIIKDLS
jgi:hypothetical protein